MWYSYYYYILNYSIKEYFITLLHMIKTIYKNMKGRHKYKSFLKVEQLSHG